MKQQHANNSHKLWLSTHDTYDWAHKPGAAWPCSFLSGRKLFIGIDDGGNLVDMSIDAGRGDQSCPADELNAIMDYYGSNMLR